jgi:hypothetical protein
MAGSKHEEASLNGVAHFGGSQTSREISLHRLAGVPIAIMSSLPNATGSCGLNPGVIDLSLDGKGWDEQHKKK